MNVTHVNFVSGGSWTGYGSRLGSKRFKVEKDWLKYGTWDGSEAAPEVNQSYSWRRTDVVRNTIFNRFMVYVTYFKDTL
jgi:hypothetical protein